MSSGETASQALADNAANIAAFVAATGVFDVRDIQYQEAFVSMIEGGGTTPTRYIAANRLSAKVNKFDQQDALYQAALTSGAKRIIGLGFGIADTKPLLDQARDLALNDARATAEVLAAAAGLKLGRVMTVTENRQPPALDSDYGMLHATGALPPPGIKVRRAYSVTVQFEVVE